ncbi:MAG: hypothetical protein ACTHK2_10560 [Dokdonella sp.]|uniref:hypothetical protein n=1 Tax=Dokdonella sp. TaxID=2291710 RepID=UPI003F7DFE70
MDKAEVAVGNTRIAFEWPADRRDLTATLARALDAILVPLGFEIKHGPRGDDFARTRGDTTLTLSGAGYDDHPYYACDVIFAVRHHVVEQLLASVIPHATSTATWVLRLSTLEDKPGFAITSVRHIEAFIKFMGKKLPALIERCDDLHELDRMITGDRTQIDGYDFASAEGPIVLAWLAGNPNFDSMVAYADTRYDRREIEGDTPIVQLADHLRRTVPVERRRPATG